MLVRNQDLGQGSLRLIPDTNVGRRIICELRPRVFDEGHAVPHVQGHVDDLLCVVLVLQVEDNSGQSGQTGRTDQTLSARISSRL